jgi:hypothetical protein
MNRIYLILFRYLSVVSCSRKNISHLNPVGSSDASGNIRYTGLHYVSGFKRWYVVRSLGKWCILLRIGQN